MSICIPTSSKLIPNNINIPSLEYTYPFIRGSEGDIPLIRGSEGDIPH